MMVSYLMAGVCASTVDIVTADELDEDDAVHSFEVAGDKMEVGYAQFTCLMYLSCGHTWLWLMDGAGGSPAM